MATCGNCAECEHEELCECCGKCVSCGMIVGSPAPATPVDTWPWRNPEWVTNQGRVPITLPSMRDYERFEISHTGGSVSHAVH